MKGTTVKQECLTLAAQTLALPPSASTSVPQERGEGAENPSPIQWNHSG